MDAYRWPAARRDANAQKLYDAVEHAHVDNRQVGIDFAAGWPADNM